MHSQQKPKIAIFVSFSGTGGVERMIINLCEGLAARDCQVDLLLIKSDSPYVEALSSVVRIIKLGGSHTLTSLFPLIGYLRRERPTALLAAKERANRVAILATQLAGVPTRVVVRLGTTVSAALTGKSRIRRWLWHLPMRYFYPRADAVVAVSQGVADDLLQITGIPAKQVQVISNPVVTSDLPTLARQPSPHPWLDDAGPPVIVAVGRLTRQKDFPTLIKAFALLRKAMPCRLIILGSGGDGDSLLALADQLEVTRDLQLPGFVTNPYAYMSRAALFVLSSIWEGSPNVLTEALALGLPVVATDCPSGPREILAEGRYGRLVPMGDAPALAKAMQATLASPPSPAHQQSAARAYTVEESSRRYLETLLERSLPS